MENLIINQMMHIRTFCSLLLLLGAVRGETAEPIKKKLQIFILAGQSNMVGHANPHTIGTLYHSDDARDKRLIQMVFKNRSGLSKKALSEQLKRTRKVDELTGGISNEKIKAMSAGPEKTALEAEVKKLKEEYEAYKNKIISACVGAGQNGRQWQQNDNSKHCVASSSHRHQSLAVPVDLFVSVWLRDSVRGRTKKT